jgi:phosphatidylserine decarboxylase
MYDFFDEWLVFLPTPTDARRYMDAFYDFTDSPEGRAVVLEEPFRNWLYNFMMARGRFMDSEASIYAIPWWTGNPDLHIEDYVIPVDGFKSFNDFFIRQLKPGVRPIASPDDNGVIISPADSTVMKIADELTAESMITVKGNSMYVRDLFGGDALAEAFIGGKAVLCMLSTTDYHRFHAPVPGDVISEAQLAGLYYGMTGGWVDYFFEHRRGYFIFDTDDFGLVGMVCVGMFTISSIEFIQEKGSVVEKGDELGHFAYGGSAIILLFEQNRVEFSIPLDRGPVYLHMGEKLGSYIAEP